MPALYFVPGILSTEMFTGGPGGQLLWVSYSRIALGQLGKLRLAGDGINPGLPDGVVCTPGGPLEPYYLPCLTALRQQLTPYGYSVFPWGFDWRKDIIAAGNDLAAAIRNVATPADPCSIVGHSQGGLVARAAWASLVASGESNLVRRIVTLGTPHQGSYSPVRVFSLTDPLIGQLAGATQLLSFVLNVVPPNIYFPAYSPAELSQLAGTWPGLYQLLPVPGSPDSSNDPSRDYLFNAANWPSDRGIDAGWLNAASTTFAAFQLNPATFPPAWVLTTAAGTGLPTAYKLSSPSLLGTDAALSFTGQGDGQVTHSSAWVTNSARYLVNCRHSDLPNEVGQSGQLAAWVRDVRLAPAPAPPAVIVGGVLNPRIAGPPIPVPLWPNHDC